MRIVTVVGARPQFIKLAVVSRCIRDKYAGKIEEVIVHTGQHYDANMSAVFFSELSIPTPHHHLGIGGGTPGENTGRMIEGIEHILIKGKFDWLLVYGDTDSTLAGTIAAAKLGVRIAHIEAGLRSYNRAMPEELNRVLTDHASHLLFTPTNKATKNLIDEGISREKIKQVGDVMQDTFLFYQDKAQEIPNFPLQKEFIVFTLHRAENTENRSCLTNIFSALNTVAKDIPVVMPIHPKTKKYLAKTKIDAGQLILIEPVSYLQMMWLLKKCVLVVTDSGGLQKEAFLFGKPCITTRNETEWVELVGCGANRLVGTDTNGIVLAIRQMYSTVVNPDLRPYGKGNAASKIVAALL